MLSLDWLKSSELKAAVEHLIEEVKKQPAKAELRTFLFQLFLVTGEWERALAQLKVLSSLNEQASSLEQIYSAAIQGEQLRAKVFSGETSPTVMGNPPSWIAHFIEAIKLDMQGEHAAALKLREAGFELADLQPGRINSANFEWLADADPRLGPNLELIVNGRYFWVPLQGISKIEFAAPTDLRDKVWAVTTITWATGAQCVGLMPTRYPETTAHKDAALLLASRTEWLQLPSGISTGIGQKMFMTNAEELALLDVRVIEFDSGLNHA